LGGGNHFVPWGLGLSGVPEITDKERAVADPELAVLSAMAHTHDPDMHKSVRIALMAHMVSHGLDADRSKLYCDLILHSLPEAARRALLEMDASTYQYQSEFARRYFGQGKAEGMAEGRNEGRVEIILELLAKRFGALSTAIEAHVRDAGSAELDGVAERVLTAGTVEEALGVSRI
jgi:Domain of unknown function (DUF4351)